MAIKDEYRPDDEADEEVDEAFYKTARDAVLFAIEVSPSMLQRPPPSSSKKADKDSAVSAALRCAYQIMQQRIITQPKDMMGILFYGTEKSKFREASRGDAADDTAGDAADDTADDTADDKALVVASGPGYAHCYLFMDLNVPSAEDVRALKDLADDDGGDSGDNDPDGILVAGPAPQDGGASMSNVLFCANQIFTTSAPNFTSRRLFLITDNDDPHAGDKAARSAAAVRAKDLYDLGVVIELFPVTRDGAQFDLAKFYDDIIYRDPDAEAGASDRVVAAKAGDGLQLLASLVSNISAKQTPKRSFFSNLTFEIAPGLAISVNGYQLLSRQTPARTTFIWLDGEKAQLAKGTTTRVDAESARNVEAGELKKAYKYGGEYVHFSPDELDALKRWPFPDDWDGRGLRIIGFKPRALIPPWAAVARSVFVFPSEQGYVGSTRVFSALWQKLLASDKVGIAWYVPRKNANPQLVAVIPSSGPDDDVKKEDDVKIENDGVKTEATGVRTPRANPIAQLPAGLWLYPLPFAEDIRKPGAEIGHRDVGALKDIMVPIIEQLALPQHAYNPSKYPNPSLQWHYKILQAMALEEEMPETPDDQTKPKVKAMAKRAGAQFAELNAAIDRVTNAYDERRVFKREAEADDDSAMPMPLAKRPKAGASTIETVVNRQERAVCEFLKHGSVASLPVAELKVSLAAKGLPTSGRKADLVARLEQWIDTRL